MKSGVYGNAELSVVLEEDVNVLNGKPLSDLVITGKFKWGQEKINEATKDGGNIEIKSISTLRPTLKRNTGETNVKPPVSIFSKPINQFPTNTDASTQAFGFV